MKGFKVTICDFLVKTFGCVKALMVLVRSSQCAHRDMMSNGTLTVQHLQFLSVGSILKSILKASQRRRPGAGEVYLLQSLEQHLKFELKVEQIPKGDKPTKTHGTLDHQLGKIASYFRFRFQGLSIYCTYFVKFTYKNLPYQYNSYIKTTLLC